MSLSNQDKKVDIQLAHELGISPTEYEQILGILGRTPTYTEIGIFSVMWSEHCSYKSSIAELKKLPRKGARLLVTAGEENAGLVDIGDGLAIAFKIESHNHPSAVEPYQGAATGVGGILRDIFTMGARPIASLNSLRFGDLSRKRTGYLLRGVVKGIGDYGNSFGVPTVAGEVYFDDCYDENPLVNAMAVGVVRHGDVTKAIARGAGNLVMITGSSTGRDGIHGATFASEELSEASEAKRPSVQVGDPFTEKLLLEATLEVIEKKLVVGIQDMGAAGITCSTSEMSARGNVGMDINLDRVPLREERMTPYEIMLSESQERMLLIVEPQYEASVRAVFRKWDLQCEVIGTVNDSGMLRISMHNELVAEIPAQPLVLGGGAPVYYLDAKKPPVSDMPYKDTVASLQEPADYAEVLLQLLQSANICSRNWITTQYDSTVRTNTVSMTGDAAVVRLKGTTKAIVLKTDCNARYVSMNPFIGAEIAVAESARNVVCCGATPIAITNCLNFGNPNDPEIYWQFKEVIQGISTACVALETPVTGGNVSFYNEHPGGAIYPTPVIGMLGLMENVEKIITPGFKEAGDIIGILGHTTGHLNGSEYLSLLGEKVHGEPPSLDLEAEKSLHRLLLNLNERGLIRSAHDCSEGGLAVSLAESTIMSSRQRFGIAVTVPAGLRVDRWLFGEDQSRIVISFKAENLVEIRASSLKQSVPFTVIGEVTNDRFQVGAVIDLPVEEIAEAHQNALERRINAR
jgi:phosphoribosylformylglycinamidine synthase II